MMTVLVIEAVIITGVTLEDNQGVIPGAALDLVTRASLDITILSPPVPVALAAVIVLGIWILTKEYRFSPTMMTPKSYLQIVMHSFWQLITE